MELKTIERKENTMKKMISILLAVIFLTVIWLPAVHASETSYAEAQWVIWNMGNVYYVRFNQNVSAVGDALHVEYIPAKSGDASVLDANAIMIYTENRLELVLQFPERILSFTVSNLVLQDGTHVRQELQAGQFKEIATQDLDWIWFLMKRDGLFSPKFLQGSLDDCDVSVGSRWRVRFIDSFFPRDDYLRAHTSLTAEGIELMQDGDEYVFSSTGQGTVSLCLFGYPRCTGSVRVMEKQELKWKMLVTTPIQYLAIPIIALRFLGPLALVFGIPLAAGMTIVTYSRLLFA